MQKSKNRDIVQYEGEYRFPGGTYIKIILEKNALVFQAGAQRFQLVPTGEAEFVFENPDIPYITPHFRKFCLQNGRQEYDNSFSWIKG